MPMSSVNQRKITNLVHLSSLSCAFTRFPPLLHDSCHVMIEMRVESFWPDRLAS